MATNSNIADKDHWMYGHRRDQTSGTGTNRETSRVSGGPTMVRNTPSSKSNPTAKVRPKASTRLSQIGRGAWSSYTMSRPQMTPLNPTEVSHTVVMRPNESKLVRCG